MSGKPYVRIRRQWRGYAAACILGTLALAAACHRAVPREENESATSTAARPQSSAPAEPQITLRQADQAAFRTLLESKRGQAVLVDCWATWCIACREQFPHTVELHRELSGQGLAVISISFDDPTDEAAQSDALAFLTNKGAAFDNLVSWQGATETAFEAFGIENGALPHYQLYDRQGRLVRKFNSGDPRGKPFTPDDIRQAVLEQLSAVDSPP